MLISYSVAICSMWSLSSLYCSGKENRIIPEEMAFRNGLVQSVRRSGMRLLAVSPAHCVSPGTHRWKWALVLRNMGVTGTMSRVECGPKQRSSDGRLESVRPPFRGSNSGKPGCKCWRSLRSEALG